MIYQNINIFINQVSKTYPHRRGIFNVSLQLEAGKLYLLVGENGSGKTTLLRCIMGLVKYQGTITRASKRIGYAPEDYYMPSFMKVIDFLESIGRIKNPMFQTNHEKLDFFLSFFDIMKYKYSTIASLSNGTRQKINLIQALIHDPEIILLDEPLTFLDEEAQAKVLQLIKEIYKDKLIIISTHQVPKFQIRQKQIITFVKGSLSNDLVD